MIVAHNLMASNAMRQYNIVGNSRVKSTEKLSSGYRINRAADDAAGLSISEKMRWQIRGLDRGLQNTQDGISFCQVADGAMDEMHGMIQRMRELAIQSANDTNTVLDREAIQREISSISEEFGRIVDTTDFNEQSVFGKERTITSYQTTSEGDVVPVGQSVSKVDGTNYGLGEVLGEGNISTSNRMTEQIYNLNKWPANKITKQYSSEQYESGVPYNCVRMDFSQMGSGFRKEDLYGLGFNSTCATCSRHYSVKFTDGNDGGAYIPMGTPDASYSNEGDGSNKVMNVDISRLNSGADVALAVLKAAGSCGITSHYTQYAVGGSGGSSSGDSVLYVFDNRPICKGTFEPIVVKTNGEREEVPVVKKHDDQGNVTIFEDRDLWIQTSQEAEDGINVQKAWIIPSTIGLDTLDVRSFEGSMNALDTLDNALDIVSQERGRMGAYVNRFEHTINNNAITSENTQAAESKIRDTDMAEEMVNQIRNNILSSAGEAMITQANQNRQSVLSLLQ